MSSALMPAAVERGRPAAVRPLPPLVLISHGTASIRGRRAVSSLVSALVAARPDLEIGAGFVDVQQPDVAASLSLLAEKSAAVVVPLLLSAGYHVNVDMRGQLRTGDVLAGALGPDDRLVSILLERILECDLHDGDSVVLACAGSSDPNAVRDYHATGARFSTILGRQVRVGFISAALPTLADAVGAARVASVTGRVVISSYLVAPGYFADRVLAMGADSVADPLLVPARVPDARLVELVLDRYQESLGGELRS